VIDIIRKNSKLRFKMIVVLITLLLIPLYQREEYSSFFRFGFPIQVAYFWYIPYSPYDMLHASDVSRFGFSPIGLVINYIIVSFFVRAFFRFKEEKEASGKNVIPALLRFVALVIVIYVGTNVVLPYEMIIYEGNYWGNEFSIVIGAGDINLQLFPYFRVDMFQLISGLTATAFLIIVIAKVFRKIRPRGQGN